MAGAAGEQGGAGTDQAAECGNQKVEVGEDCDGTDLGTADCASFGYAEGKLACSADCAFDMSECVAAPACGNGTRDANELCDGSEVGGATCLEQGFLGGGVLGCDGACAGFDTTHCKECPGTAGPPMVKVATTYCVDSTEVTRAQYAAFLDSNPSLSEQPEVCAWNALFDPSGAWPPSATEEMLPVTRVDWCDAHAYCKWTGKRLCGAIGGGPVADADVFNEAVSQWHRACSQAGARTYAYGDTFQTGHCAINVPEPVPVASLPLCEGGYAGLFDMSGNVSEWEDACDAQTGATDLCRTRGGNYTYADSGGTCSAVATSPRNALLASRGIRCCSP